VLRLVDVVRGHVGAGEQAILAAFQEAKRLAPTILFIDEFQAIFVSRGGSGGSGGSDDKSLSSMLAGCFDDVALWNANAGSGATVTVIAATNEPWAVDAGVLRPGRFDRCHLVGVLSDQERRHILGNALAADPRTKGYTGADAERLLLLLLASSSSSSSSPHTTTTLPPPPSVTPDELSAYVEFQEQHQKGILF
jgi:AAA family ATPase